jgi:hypothetical protein
MKLNDMTRRFLMGESKDPPSIQSYIQAIKEILASMHPRSETDRRRFEMAHNHLRNLKREVRRLEQQVESLKYEKEMIHLDSDVNDPATMPLNPPLELEEKKEE